MDGIDTALVRIDGSGPGLKAQLVDWLTTPYPRGLKSQLLDMISAEKTSLNDISQLNFLIGDFFADSVLELLRNTGTAPEDVDLVGSHGQTVWHQPENEMIFEKKIHSTMQIGEPSVIRARTGIITVADFRVMDIALGGEGAPLIPYFDYLFLRSETENRASLNLGGIANFTVIPAGAELNEIYAFDTGPANMLIDLLTKHLFNKEFDEDGKIATLSPSNAKLLSKMKRHPFIAKTPPKSTGREMFGSEYADKILRWAKDMNCSDTEIISTAVEFTVQSIKKNYEQFIQPDYPLKKIIMNGGGTKNKELMKRLMESFRGNTGEGGINLVLIDDSGIPADIKEAVAFAVYASETVCGNPVSLPRVTGARSSGISGKIIL